jgi:uroporphyrinogen decarboxylase
MWYGAEPDTTRNVRAFLGLADDEALVRRLGIDTRTIRPRYIGPELKRYDDGTFDTYWGIRRGGGFWGIALNTPLAGAETVADVEAHAFPNSDWFDVAFTAEDRLLSEEYFIIGGMWSPFWHDTLELLGLEKMLVDMKHNPGLVEAVLDRTFDLHYSVSVRAFGANPGLIDMFWFANDFGTQKGLIIHPEMWRKYFKQRIRKLADLGHRHGLKVAMHSCGDIHAIIPDLIEIGIEILNPIQVSAANMDPAILKREYGRDLVFFGAIDYNEILNHGTEEVVRAEVRRIIDLLGRDGRYIVAPSHDLMMSEVPPRNIWAMYDEARRYSSSIAPCA